MKENLLQKWCDQAWLHCIYLIGIIMGNILLIKWPVWEVPQRLICLLAIMVPLHVFEENTAPGGFFYMNNLGQKGKKTLYGPGTITSYICLLPLSVYGCLWLSENPFTASQAILGIAIVLFIIIFLILIPFTFSKRIKSQKYAFSSAGYFSKYE